MIGLAGASAWEGQTISLADKLCSKPWLRWLKRDRA